MYTFRHFSSFITPLLLWNKEHVKYALVAPLESEGLRNGWRAIKNLKESAKLEFDIASDSVPSTDPLEMFGGKQNIRCFFQGPKHMF